MKIKIVFMFVFILVLFGCGQRIQNYYYSNRNLECIIRLPEHLKMYKIGNSFDNSFDYWISDLPYDTLKKTLDTIDFSNQNSAFCLMRLIVLDKTVSELEGYGSPVSQMSDYLAMLGCDENSLMVAEQDSLKFVTCARAGGVLYDYPDIGSVQVYVNDTCHLHYIPLIEIQKSVYALPKVLSRFKRN